MSSLTTSQVRVRSRIALIGVMAAWLVVALLIYGNINPAVVEDTSSAFGLLAGTAFALSILLWVVMILEFIRERPAQHPWVWGFLLMTGPVLGPLAFYYRIWRPRHAAGRPNNSLERARER